MEIAKCSLGADAPASALEEAARADALDYACHPDECAKFHLERPWDRHLQPLVAALRSRGQDRGPGVCVDPVDTAVELVQGARETRAAGVRRERLAKAVAALEQVPLVQPFVLGDGGGGGAGEGGAAPEQDAAERYRSARLLTGLWGEVVKVAWAQHLYDIVLRAAPHVLWPEWTAGIDEEMAMLQVRACWCAAAEPCGAVGCACAPTARWHGAFSRRRGCGYGRGARGSGAAGVCFACACGPCVTHRCSAVQCQCMYFEAEAAVVALKRRGEAVVPPVLRGGAGALDGAGSGEGGAPDSSLEGGGDGSGAAAAPEVMSPGPEEETCGRVGVRAAAETAAELQQTVSQGFIRGMQRASECKKPWAVINGAVYCWNAYLPAMQNGWCVLNGCAGMNFSPGPGVVHAPLTGLQACRTSGSA